MRVKSIALFLILITQFSRAQQNDTAFTNVANLPDDSIKSKRLYRAGLTYSNLKPEMCLPIADECERIGTKINWPIGAIAANHLRGLYNERQGNFKKAISYYMLSFELGQKINHKRTQVLRANDIGRMYSSQGKYKEAVDYYLKSIKIAGEAKMSASQAYSYIGLGELFREQKNYAKAETYYKEALNIALANDDKKVISACYNNLGIVYGEKGNPKEGITYHLKALEIKKEMNDLFGIGLTYEMLANRNAQANDYNKAIEYIENSLKIARQLNNRDAEAEDLCNLGHYYLETGKLNEAEKTLNESIKIASEIGFNLLLQECYKHLSRVYGMKKNFSKAYEYNLKYTELKDSILNKESAKQVAEMEARFENEKNELEIKNLNSEKALQQTEIEKKEAEVKKQNIQKIAFASGFVLMLILAVVIFKGYNDKKKSNKIISEQKHQVEYQKEIIEEKQREVVDSINYAKRIQQTILAHNTYLEQQLGPENIFVFFKPKDIVSGDFYWATHKNDSFYMAVCDSTGHGVPGAFMSLLNIGYLSEAINEKAIYEPHLVLNYVRERLITSVNKDGQKDGFDGILLKLTTNNSITTATYSAAFNSPVIISNNLLSDLPCDKMPVGIGERSESFRLHTIDIKKGDTIYLYTDGYADQFGGPNGKKFKYRQLEELLLNIHLLPVKEQENILSHKLDEWRGELEQVDDILVVGIKV
ncbi:MAG: tetratricopeptide repeat protein [Bacteroidia bacterium]